MNTRGAKQQGNSREAKQTAKIQPRPDWETFYLINSKPVYLHRLWEHPFCCYIFVRDNWKYIYSKHGVNEPNTFSGSKYSSENKLASWGLNEKSTLQKETMQSIWGGTEKAAFLKVHSRPFRRHSRLLLYLSRLLRQMGKVGGGSNRNSYFCCFVSICSGGWI